jgi:hypothetical protein
MPDRRDDFFQKPEDMAMALWLAKQPKSARTLEAAVRE